ncbi:MAG: thiol-activated cytolysin family protein [Paludibacteraceae bacterium]|nr:thiol-activated cytolysin family protein [Paludibacteraceae bacterium]
MKKNFITVPLLLAACMLMPISSCKDSDDDDSAPASESLDKYIRSLPEATQEAATGVTETEDAISDTSETDICTTHKYKASEAYSEVALLNPTSDVIYVGSLLDGSSISNGRYTPVTLNRAPMNISTNFSNVVGKDSTTVECPTLSTVRGAIKKMIDEANINGSTAATISYEIKEVNSEEELNVAIGANVKSSAMDIAGKFHFNSDEKKSHFLVKFVQSYYTVDMDLPASPSSLFAPDVTSYELGNALTAKQNVPVYVSSVKYGRMAYFAIESNDSSKAVETALNASFSSLSTKGKLDEASTSSGTFNSCTMRGMVIGDAADDAVKAINGKDAIINFITSGSKFSKESASAPIAFTLRKLSDNKVYNVVNGGEYAVRKCRSVFGKATIKPVYFYGVDGDNDPYGTITVQLGYGDKLTDNVYYLLNTNSNQYVTTGAGQTYTFPNDQNLQTLNVDETKANPFIVVTAKLWDHDGSNGNDEYETVTKRYNLKNFQNKYKDEMDGDGNIILQNAIKTINGDYALLRFAFKLTY